MKNSSVGSLIGSIGGLMFVVLNSGALPTPWPIVCRVVGLTLFVVLIGLAVGSRNRPADEVVPRAGALRVYSICVVAMVAAIPVGASFINRQGAPHLTVLWVIFVVGAHFIPFRNAFRQPIFGYLGVALMLVAVIGAGLALGDLAQPATFAVVAGFTLQAFSLAGLVPVGGRQRPSSDRSRLIKT